MSKIRTHFPPGYRKPDMCADCAHCVHRIMHDAYTAFHLEHVCRLSDPGVDVEPNCVSDSFKKIVPRGAGR
jgi:hypothetical protein